jgi:predicted DsbA family dithiol-disulfide isomerase
MNNAKSTPLIGSVLWLALLCAAMGQTPAAEQCPAPGGSDKHPADETVAVVAGQPILKSDLDTAVKSTMMALHNQEFQIKSKVLEDLIRQRVVEAEAKKQGITVEQLYAKEVDSRIPTPIDAEVFAYYLGIRSQINKPFKEVRAQLQTNLKALEVKQMRDDYVDYLRGHADIAVMFQPPRVGVDYDRDRLRGDANAPVTIVEFADYQCPYCEKAEASLRELIEKYPGKVNVAFRDFPLTSIHPYAQKASEAARCAGKQGKFWEYHDRLFDAQAKLDEPGLRAESHTLGLDEEAFSSCLESGEFAKEIERDREDGKRAGVSSTPGFFINGIFLNGAQPAAEFEKIIDSELKAAKNQAASGSLRVVRDQTPAPR